MRKDRARVVQIYNLRINISRSQTAQKSDNICYYLCEEKYKIFKNFEVQWN